MRPTCAKRPTRDNPCHNARMRPTRENAYHMRKCVPRTNGYHGRMRTTRHTATIIGLCGRAESGLATAWFEMTGPTGLRSELGLSRPDRTFTSLVCVVGKG